MSKFAKLFEDTAVGQVLVTLDSSDEEGTSSICIRGEDYKGLQAEVSFGFPTASIEETFEAVEADRAVAAVLDVRATIDRMLASVGEA